MSLDITLSAEPQTRECRCSFCDNVHLKLVAEELYSANITHNLSAMAESAGIYKHLWRPEEIGITKAEQLIEPLAAGLDLLESDPDRFEKCNASNGWGMYKHFVPFVAEYLTACRQYPQANVSVDR